MEVPVLVLMLVRTIAGSDVDEPISAVSIESKQAAEAI